MYQENQITAHIVTHTQEFFLYYAVKAIYDYMDVILIYWNGPINESFQEILEDLNELDIDKKLVIEEHQLEFDEWNWNLTNINSVINSGKNKKGVGFIRKLQIYDTNTEFFMIVDADEIHYQSTMETIKNKIIPNWDDSKICGFLPLEWYYDHEKIFNCYSPVGRIFKTQRTFLNNDSPNEMHINITDGKVIELSDLTSLDLSNVKGIKPFAHFEKFLKPFRRKIPYSSTYKSQYSLPEAFKNTKYLDEYLKHYEPSHLKQVKIEFLTAIRYNNNHISKGTIMILTQDEYEYLAPICKIKIIKE